MHGNKGRRRQMGGFPVRISNFSGEWCIRNVLVWNEDDASLTDIAQCILGVMVRGIK